MIRWKRGDYVRLGRAVADFNKKLSQLEQENKKLYLPVPIDYQNIKNDIYSRRQLQNTINSLRRFMREDAADLYKTEAGVEMTKWERRELGIKARVGVRHLEKELKPYNVKDESGYSRAQMGHSAPKSIKTNIKNLQNIERLKSLKEISPFINFIGRSDYSYKKAIIYRENYFTMLKETFEGLPNYQILIDYLNKNYSNPVEFWEFIKDYELYKDIEYMYTLSDQENRLNRMLDELGIPYEE